MKMCAVVVRGIYKAIAGGHVYRVSARDVVRTHFRFTGQMKSGPILPAGNKSFAGLVLLYCIRCRRRPLDLRNGQTVALLDVKNGVIGQHKRRAAVLILAGVFVFCFSAAELLIENDLCTLLTF